jgi:hypothetical protein
VLQEVLLQRRLVLTQEAFRSLPVAAAQALQAAVEVFIEVALDRTPGDIRQTCDLVMRQAMTLEPEDLHLALDAGVRMMP